MNFRLIILDLDGTLIDSERDLTKALNLTMKDFGLVPVSEALVTKSIGSGVRRLLESILQEQGMKDISEKLRKSYLPTK